MRNVNLSNLIGKSYNNVFIDIEKGLHRHYVFKGGRGSLKSSFVFIYVIWAMTRDALNGKTTHCVALRKVKDTCYDSLYQNFEWAIELLGVGDLWHGTVSPMKLKFRDSTILFRGSNNKQDYKKIKSIKFKKGFCKHVIYEECVEFFGMNEIGDINRSLFRGGSGGIAYYMYNPPNSKKAWTNIEFDEKLDIPNRYYHHSTYLTAPKEWLGDDFIEEADIMKKINPRLYNHVYLGLVFGEGLEIYENLEIRTITDNEIEEFFDIKRGLDFGFTKDASCYGDLFYNDKKQWVYIFDEVYGHRLSNKSLYDKIYPKSGFGLIRADSAEPRTINELRTLGLNIIGAKKGKDSKNHGIKFLSDRAKIIIDRKRCPFICSDFELYEYEKDKEDNIIYEYPKEPHGSAMSRYALDEIIRRSKIRFGGEK